MKKKFNMEDVLDYLIQKIIDNDCTGEEYGLYIDLRTYGKKILNDEYNRKLLKKILRDMRLEWDGIYEDGE
jgi:hypothetical protein